MRAAALALLVAALAAVAASTSAAAVESGTIVVNRGAAGIRLGMTRATVVDRLGPPLYENQNGFMEYSNDNLFDVYLGGAKRVRLLGVSGRHFCTRSGICMRTRYGLKRLKAQFGSRLKEIEDETGETVFVVRGRHKGHRVFTSFSTSSLRPRARIIQVFIGRCPPKPAVCGA